MNFFSLFSFTHFVFDIVQMEKIHPKKKKKMKSAAAKNIVLIHDGNDYGLRSVDFGVNR